MHYVTKTAMIVCKEVFLTILTAAGFVPIAKLDLIAILTLCISKKRKSSSRHYPHFFLPARPSNWPNAYSDLNRYRILNTTS